jgi:hypothetical protein
LLCHNLSSLVHDYLKFVSRENGSTLKITRDELEIRAKPAKPFAYLGCHGGARNAGGAAGSILLMLFTALLLSSGRTRPGRNHGGYSAL